MVNSNNNYVFNVRVNGNNIKEYNHNGKVYIEGRKGTEYTLNYKNNTYNKIKVIFSVDGLSVIDGKEASDKSKGYIVNGYDSITIPGWTINDSTVAKFEFRPQGDKENFTYVEALKEEGVNVDIMNQGLIGCMVFKEKYNHPKHVYHHYNKWPYYNEPLYCSGYAEDIPNMTRGISNMNMYTDAMATASLNQNQQMSFVGHNGIQNFMVQEASLGTGFGEDINFSTNTVYFESELNPDWIFAFQYDTIGNLKKLGVVVDKVAVKQAFPGYNSNYCQIPKNRG